MKVLRKTLIALSLGVLVLSISGEPAAASSGDLGYVEKTYSSPSWGPMNYSVSCPAGVAVAGYGFAIRDNGSITEASSQSGTGNLWVSSISVPSSGSYVVKVAAICRG